MKRAREVVLRFPVTVDDTAGGLFPEGVKASAFALAAMQADRDYCDSVRASSAFDAVIESARVRCLLNDVAEAGGRLSVEDGTLRARGPKGFLTDALAERIRENKTRLMKAIGGGE